jgi:protein-disulfide isomerase
MQTESSHDRKAQLQRARAERRRFEAQERAHLLRERRLKQLAAIAVTAVALVALVVITLGSGGGAPPAVANAEAVTAEVAGVPQADMTLGSSHAAVTIHEYGDLQCTACSMFATDTLPGVIDKLVKSGNAKLSFHNWPIIDQTDSVTAARASYAAARQNRAWQFIELFYRNQGTERSGYVTDAFLDRVAAAAGIDVARFDADRRTSAVAARVQADARQALAYGFQGTPSFVVTGPRGTRVLGAGSPDSVRPFEDAVRAVT